MKLNNKEKIDEWIIAATNKGQRFCYNKTVFNLKSGLLKMDHVYFFDNLMYPAFKEGHGEEIQDRSYLFEYNEINNIENMPESVKKFKPDTFLFDFVYDKKYPGRKKL